MIFSMKILIFSMKVLIFVWKSQIFSVKNLNDFLFDFLNDSQNLLLQI